MIASFAEKIRILVVSYSKTSPELSDRQAYPTFYRVGPSDKSAASVLAARFIRFHWTSCTIIYQNEAFGSDGARVIKGEFFCNKHHCI